MMASEKEGIVIAQIMGKMVGGGLESSVLNYFRHIDKNVFTYDFVVDSDSTYVPQAEIRSLGGRIHFVSPYQDVRNNQKDLYELFSRECYPIVHSHLNTLSVFPLHAAKKAGIPTRIAHSHATMGKGEAKRNAVKTMLKSFSKVYPTHLAACSKYAGEWLFGKNANVKVIPNAIELNAFSYNRTLKDELKKSLGLNASDQIIGHVGRLEKTKNQEFLIRVFEIVHKSRPDTKLLLCGCGTMEASLRELVRDLGLSEVVTFLGQRNDIAKVYQVFDVFAFPSLYEGFGMALLEAQKAGVTCVASDRIPGESILSDWCHVLPLEAGVQAWSKVLLDSLGVTDAVRAKRSQSDNFDSFEISAAAKNLERYYESLYRCC